VKACYSYQPSCAIFGLNSLPSIAAFTNPEQRELLPNHHPRRREHLTHVLLNLYIEQLIQLGVHRRKQIAALTMKVMTRSCRKPLIKKMKSVGKK
jgi:hypothetical protein